MSAERLLVILYEVPEKPVRIKVSSWRKLRRLGGLYPRLSLCVLPDTEKTRRELRETLEEIRKWGLAAVLEAAPIAKEDFNSILAVLRGIKEKEYLEILEECEEFLAEIRENIEKGNVRLEEAQELEEMLDSLVRWFREASSTDWLGTTSREEVARKLEECEKALEEFTSICLSNFEKSRAPGS